MTEQFPNPFGPDAQHNQPAWLELPDSPAPQPESTACPATAGQVGTWLAWHSLEIASVVIPLALSVTVSAWFLALAALCGTAWAANELRVARRTRVIQPGAPRALLPSDDTTPTKEGRDDDD
nr:hypothetical protein [Kibdelosporangium sp. MJ126-NF4]CEL15088.1 hypothetical protein [Kibdelosporangium sp. MJ126-NF4]CTQ93318.1 hypothetical protein [Kibdelosporangium sp. MJ126-NF4]